MNAARGTGPFEIALVGDFQCGKSTTFNAILGRSLSPCGIGVKTSACAVTARALAPDEPEPYAEPVWRSKAWLDAIRREDERDDTEWAEWRESPDLRRVAALIRRFGASSDLASLRVVQRTSLQEVLPWVSYPRDWERLWLNDPSGEGFALEEVLFVFLERVVFHIRSEALSKLGCDLTDAPGFGTGPWDVMLSREAMARASMALCVIDGRGRTLSGPCIDEFSWLLRCGMGGKALFVQNGMVNEAAETLARTNAALLSQRGFPIQGDGIALFNALVATARGQGLTLRDSGLLNLLGRMADFASRLRDNDKYDQGAAIRWVRGEPEPSPGYDWQDGFSAFSKLLEGVRWVPGTVAPGSCGVVSSAEEGRWELLPGYRWKENLTLGIGDGNSRKTFADGAVWVPNSGHPSDSHVTSCEEEGLWIPAPGFVWEDTWTEERRGGELPRSVWRPGIRHRERPHVRAARAEGEWIREEKRDRDEILPLVQTAKHGKFFTGPGMPSGKLFNAKASMKVPVGTEVLALYDDTVWGGSREGILVANTGVFAKAFLEEPQFWKWNDVKTVECRTDGLLVNGECVQMTMGEDGAPFAAALTRVLRTLAQ